jgi:hypothetical protein
MYRMTLIQIEASTGSRAREGPRRGTFRFECGCSARREKSSPLGEYLWVTRLCREGHGRNF